MELNALITEPPPIVIFGASSHGLVVLDAVEQGSQFKAVAFVDDAPKGVLPIPVWSWEELKTNKRRLHGIVVGIGENHIREKITKRIQDELTIQLVTVVHPFTSISPSAKLGNGVVVLAGANIGPHAVIHDGCLLNTHSSLDHHGTMHPFSSLVPGVVTGGHVSIGSGAALCLGVSVIHNVHIGVHAVVGAGAAVVNSVPDHVVVMGVPAKVVRKRVPQDTYLHKRHSTVRWCPHKPLDHEFVQHQLQKSQEQNRFTNGGPLQAELARLIHSKLGLSREVVVACTASGTSALHCLVGAYAIKAQRKLRCVTQTFTFPCSVQGNLMDSLSVDLCPVHWGPCVCCRDIKEEFDAVIVTNCFGTTADLPTYVDWCREHNKLLFLDNANTPLSFVDNKNTCEWGDGTIVSLHETKPLGRGEGGFVVVPREMEKCVQRAMNFGFQPPDRTHHACASNYRMSDFAAAYHLDFWTHCFETTRDRHTNLQNEVVEWLQKNPDVKIPFVFDPKHHWLGCLPLLFPFPVEPTAFRGIEAKKYYQPLRPTAYALDIFSRIVCLPFHRDMHVDDLRFVLRSVEGVLLTKTELK